MHKGLRQRLLDRIFALFSITRYAHRHVEEFSSHEPTNLLSNVLKSPALVSFRSMNLCKKHRLAEVSLDECSEMQE